MVLTSKQVHDEVLDVLYAQKAFKLRLYWRSSKDASNCFSALPQRVRQRIQNLDIGAIYDRGTFVSCTILHDPEFPTVLAVWDRICLDLYQPLFPDVLGMTDYRVRAWLQWLAPILTAINEHANEKLTVQATYAGEESKELVDCLTRLACDETNYWRVENT